MFKPVLHITIYLPYPYRYNTKLDTKISTTDITYRAMVTSLFKMKGVPNRMAHRFSLKLNNGTASFGPTT